MLKGDPFASKGAKAGKAKDLIAASKKRTTSNGYMPNISDSKREKMGEKTRKMQGLSPKLKGDIPYYPKKK